MFKQNLKIKNRARYISLLCVMCMLLTCFAAMPVFAEQTDASGEFSDITTGTANTFTYLYAASTKTLTIGTKTGDGRMNLDETTGTQWQGLPWYSYRGEIENIVVEEGVKQLGRSVFRECTALKNIQLPASLERTQWGAISCCTALESVTVPEGFLYLGDKTFDGCTALTSLSLPTTLTNIQKNVILGTAVTALTIPYKTTLVATSFDNLPNLTLTIYNGSAADSWNSASFEGSIVKQEYTGTILASGTFPDKSGTENVFSWKVNDLNILTIEGTGEMKDYDDNWTPIDRPWKDYQSKITRVVVSEGVSATGKRVFESCTVLESVVLPSTLRRVATYTFNGCPKITTLNIPNGVTALDAQALYNMSGLTSVTIPSSVSTITANVFNKTNNNLEISVYGGTKAWELAKTDPDIKNTDNNNGKRTWTILNSETGTVLNSNVTWTMNWDVATEEASLTFSGMGDIPDKSPKDWIGYRFYTANAVFESGLTNVGKECLSTFEKLADVSIADTVTNIRDRAFAWCESLTQLTLPEGIKILGVGIVQGSSNITELTIPKSVTTLYPNGKYSDKTFVGTVSGFTLKIYTESPAYAWSKGSTGESGNADGLNVEYLGNEKIHLISDENGFGVFTPEDLTDAVLVFANYEYNAATDAPGELKNASIKTGDVALGYTNITVPTEFTDENGTITKVYFWNSISDMKPLCSEVSKKNKPKLVLAGDSIMAPWEQTELRYPQQGWGESFRSVFDGAKIEVTNEAVSGYTAKAFYDNKWTTGVKDTLSAGDYLVVSFLHNDYCTSVDTTKSSYDTRYIETYTEYLKKYIDECKAMGVNLIFVQPPNKGVNYDFHNNTKDTQYGNFTAVMPKLAADNNIPFINVHKWTLDLLTNDATYEQTMKDIYLYKLVERELITEAQHQQHLNLTVRNSTDATDTTHISLTGCQKIAEYVAQQLKSVSPALAAYLK